MVQESINPLKEVSFSKVALNDDQRWRQDGRLNYVRLCGHILEAAEYAWEKCEDEAPRKLTEGRPPNALHYALPVEPLPTPEGELRRQLEKADWRGGQYDYVFFEGNARQGPYKVRQALAHLHVVLGHPSADRLQ